MEEKIAPAEAKGPFRCPRCGISTWGALGNCPQCGQPLNIECPECGGRWRYIYDYKYCPSCGAKVRSKIKG